MGDLIGIHYLLATTPLWKLAPFLYLATDGVIHFLRDKKEGFAYQTSWSAKYGDLALLSVVLMVASDLHDGVYVPSWAGNPWIQAFLLVASVAAGIVICVHTIGQRSGKPGESGQFGDIYHDVVVAPFILFSAITLLPVIWYSADWVEQYGWTAAMAAIWAWLVYRDFKSDRINQREYIAGQVQRGLTWIT